MKSGPRGEGILTSDEVPYKVPLLLSDVQKLEDSKFNSYMMTARVAAVKQGGKWVYLSNWRKKFNIDEKLEEFEEEVARVEEKEKLNVPKTENDKQKFQFYLPKRLGEICEDPESMEEINSRTLLGMFVGKRNKSLCIVMVPLEKAVAGKAAGKKRKAEKTEGDNDVEPAHLARKKKTERSGENDAEAEAPASKKKQSESDDDEGEHEDSWSIDSSDEN